MFVPKSLSCPSITIQERQPPAYKKRFTYSTGGVNDQVLCEILCDIFLHIEKSRTPSYGIVVSLDLNGGHVSLGCALRISESFDIVLEKK